MILISRDEKHAVLEKFPNVHIVRTCKQRSKRHRYYMVEEAGPMRLIVGANGRQWHEGPVGHGRAPQALDGHLSLHRNGFGGRRLHSQLCL